MPGYHLPYFAAVDSGIFREHGLDVELLAPAPGPANPLRVAAGGADFCLTSVAYYLQAWAAQPGLDARFVMAIAQRGHMAAYVIDGRPTAAGTIPHHPRDLAGATIGGAPDAKFVMAYRTFLQQVWDVADTPTVPMTYEAAMTGLGQGRCDVFADYIDLRPRVERRNPGLPVRAFHFAHYGLTIYGSGLVANGRLIQERPDVLVRVIHAIRAAFQATRENPKAGLEGLLRCYPDTEPDYALDGWRESARLIFGWEAEALGPGWLDADQ
ncbi:MAG: ABC transporter substrate-binding protein, partial [Anaerolineae bacterium]|nr:ABC transporter substrate-binding protein [Anaerolineae bacterium]